MNRFAVLAGSFAYFLLACGASTSRPTLGASAQNSEASVATKASEPRASDPTAAAPAPASNAYGNLGMTGSPASAPPTSTPVTPEPAPHSMVASPPPKRIGARHVLVQWMGAEHAPSSVVRSREQALAVAQEVHRRARAKDDFARLAVEYSDEPNAGQRGGSLGRFGHGQMVPAFEDAAFKLQIGEISAIVESPFGFHVIQRTE